MTDDELTPEEQNRAHLDANPSLEGALWTDWVRTVCGWRKMLDPTEDEWVVLRSGWYPGQAPVDAVAHLEKLRAKGSTAITVTGIDTGDTVRNIPTGEEWTVACVRGDRLSWCGWPEGMAALADCTLVKKATPEDRDKLLRELADMGGSDHRQRYAQARLAAQQP